jgi:hypothetical protein
MPKEITFEAQIRQDGGWQTIGVFEDRETATSEVERRLGSWRAPAVRVLQVIFDRDSNQCTEHTVFRATGTEEESAPAANPRSGIDLFRRGRRRPPRQRRRDHRLMLLLSGVCLVIIAVSLGALF